MPDLSATDYEHILTGKFPKGKPADPTQNMSAEQKKEWEAMNEEHGDKFKTARRDGESVESLLKDMQRALQHLERRPSSRSELITIQTLGVDVQMHPTATRDQRATSDRIITKAVALAKTASHPVEESTMPTNTDLRASYGPLIGADETDTDAKFKSAKVGPRSRPGTRVVLRANPASRMLYRDLPPDGTGGEVTTVAGPGGRMSYMPGPGGGLLYVQFDDGSFMGVSPNDLDPEGRGMAAADETDTDAKFEKGKPADPTKNMSPADKAKWEKSKDEHKDQFKTAWADDPIRQRTTWAREASPDKTAAASGLYGYTRKTQLDVEASVRKLQRRADNIARSIWKKDERVASFLAAHSKRASSAPARLLLSALKGLGPKVASNTRLALEDNHADLYDRTMLIAEAHEPHDTSRALAAAVEMIRHDSPDVTRADFRAVAALLERDLAASWNATREAGSSAMMFSLAVGVSPHDAKEAVVAAQRYLGPDYEVYQTHSIGDVQVVNVKPKHMAEGDWFEGFGALFNHFIDHMKSKGYRPDVRGSMYMNRAFIQGLKSHNGRLASELPEILKEAAEKEAEYGLYGYRSRTAQLGLTACAQVREVAGQVAYDLHSRRQAKYDRITGFLKEHSKAARCRYSKLLLASYPDAPIKIASREPTASTERTASPPSSVDDWIAWEG